MRLTREALRARKGDRAAFRERARLPISLILDDVQGTYNQGAIFRLCDAFMLEKVHLCGAALQTQHRRFLKAARGTHGWVPYTEHQDILAVLDAYRAKGYQLIAVEQCEGSVPIHELRFSSRVCLILGGELSGVSEPVLARADVIAELPSDGMANSLNVAMSAGIAVYAAYSAMRFT